MASIDGLLASVGDLLVSVDGLLASVDGVLASVDWLLASVDGILASVDGLLASVDGLLASVDGLLASVDGLLTSRYRLDNLYGIKWLQRKAGRDSIAPRCEAVSVNGTINRTPRDLQFFLIAFPVEGHIMVWER